MHMLATPNNGVLSTPTYIGTRNCYNSLALGTGVASAIRSQQEKLCAQVYLWLTAPQEGFSILQPTELLHQAL